MVKEQPVKTNEIIELEITGIGRKGDGIGKYNGFIIMVPNTEINNKYTIRITNVHETFAFGIKEEN